MEEKRQELTNTLQKEIRLPICALLKSGLRAAILSKKPRKDNILFADLGDILFSKCTSLNSFFEELKSFFIER